MPDLLLLNFFLGKLKIERYFFPVLTCHPLFFLFSSLVFHQLLNWFLYRHFSLVDYIRQAPVYLGMGANFLFFFLGAALRNLKCQLGYLYTWTRLISQDFLFLILKYVSSVGKWSLWMLTGWTLYVTNTYSHTIGCAVVFQSFLVAVLIFSTIVCFSPGLVFM